MKSIKLSIALLALAAGALAQYTPPTSAGIINKFPTQLFCPGDSYILGTGAQNVTAQNACALIDKAIPGNVVMTNAAVGGFTSDQILYQTVNFFNPKPNVPSVSIINGGANDAACGTSAACVNNYTQAMDAAIAWLAIPYSARIMASNCASSGSWSTDSTLTMLTPSYIANPGTAVSSTASGATRTCSIPSSASPVIGVNFQVTNAQAGNFTVTIDGSLVTNSCTSSTTFVSGPCGGNTLNQATTMFRQEYAVTPNQAHTVLITLTNSVKVDLTAVDWVPAAASTPSLSGVFVVNTNAIFTNFATYNTALATLTSALKTDGLLVYLVDLINGTPGVNSTTDIATSATASCDGSTTASHPNSQCGYLHMAQTIYNAELANGYVFSGPPSGQNNISAAQLLQIIPTSIDITGRTSAISGAALPIGSTNGLYLVGYLATVSTAATASSILGGTTGFSIHYFDGSDFVTRDVIDISGNQLGAVITTASGNTTNTTAAVSYGFALVNCIGGFAPTYSFGYSSTGATPMAYAIHVRVVGL